ncbi:ribonuclease R family protein [Aporhodopirellula aestuarii]|uniref:Ribonuclease R n=1 Tax=Aporhodopirellula aestuarii TaxID=2950107 RepID=A0ABT0U6C8_9BACT|nr:VacB/RNase II family 3'-5' exoribonuclease [Aporhodopirellula aestuarii]MCM2372453.1 VacB/RNase II family 3'-5' exoribonuclease [Aporhodopirellula aestuarii]
MTWSLAGLRKPAFPRLASDWPRSYPGGMEVSQQLTDRLLRWVHAAEYRPSKPKQIATHLKLDGDGYRELRRVIKQLVLEGRLVYGGNHLVMAAAAVGGSADHVRGKFRRAMGGGFGFVRPSSGGTDADGDVPEDIFVPPGATGGAMEGDLVEVEISPGRRGGVEGIVVAVVQRERRQFTGTFRTKPIPPEDEDRERAPAIDGPVVYLDGVHFNAPVGVGDVRGLPLVDDDKVFVEIVEFPDDDGGGGEAVILERLGSSKNPAIDTLTVMRQYGLPDEFPAAVLDEARKRADEFDEDDLPADRTDLSDLLTITIDPFDARDFDDAISLAREDGRWRLWVHIADVSHFVHVGGAIDVEARKRGTSVYLPDRVIPMIPEIISNHLASLQPERRRLVKSVEIEFTDDLTITHTEVHNAVIHSDKRFNYEQIDQYLASPQSFKEEWGAAICELLDQMHTLAMKMRKKRFREGSLSMDMPDIKLELDRLGKVKGAYLVEHTESHQIIEEFMLAGNQAVAYWLDNLELNFLHRIHEPPERRKLRSLTSFVKDLGIGIDNVESRFEIQAVLDKVAGTPMENAVNFAVLKSMNKAVYGPHREGHYALDMEHYCHFTSPIRRYPDLSVHRLVQKLIDKKSTPDESFAELVKLGHECSDAERNAASAERELIQLKLLHFLKKKVGETLEAVISRVFADGLHARCVKLPVDGFIPVTTLPGDQYRFERRGHLLVGFKEGNQFRLGDLLLVRIDKVDLQDRQLYLKVVKNLSGGKGAARGPKPAAKAKSTYKTKRKTERREKKKKRRR